MDYTPFANLTDDEFITHLSVKENPTDEEMEAMLRLERHVDTQSELEETFKRLMERTRENIAESRAIRMKARDNMDLFQRGVYGSNT